MILSNSIDPVMIRNNVQASQLYNQVNHMEADRSGLLHRAQPNLRNQSEALKEVCVEFESLFISQMYKSMRKTVHMEESLLYGGQAEEIFTDMLNDEYAMLTARSTNLGLADALFKQLSAQLAYSGNMNI